MKSFLLVLALGIYPLFISLSRESIEHHTFQKEGTEQSPISTIKAFLDWYGKNYKSLYRFNVTYTDTLGNYRVNIPDCTRYFNSLTTSGFISQEYVRLWSDYCVSQDQKFVITPQNEGPPEGFDIDLVLLTQEPEEVTKQYNNFSYVISKTDASTSTILVDTRWPDWVYVFELSKINERWYIDYISIKEPE